MTRTSAFTLGAIVAAAPVLAQESAEELAKKLSNPVSSMISVPFQYNYDEGFGPERRGHKSQLNIQPVVPISLDQDWNLISRTILPVIAQRDIVPGTKQSGIGDITQSLFLSPKKPTANGVLWGAGPVFLIPTGSKDALTADRWGIGPTAVVLKQEHAWTYGALANHIWSVGGGSDRPDISSTFLQPFVAHTTKTAWTYNANIESTYDWKAKQWSVPINFQVSKMLKLGDMPVSVGGGVRYWLDSADGGPHGWGARVVVTLVFPR
jgi:hypothetical protein